VLFVLHPIERDRSGPLPTTAHERRLGATVEAIWAISARFASTFSINEGSSCRAARISSDHTVLAVPAAVANPQARRWPAVTWE
jgi:hypothetical protein